MNNNIVENNTISVLNMNDNGSLEAVYLQNRWKPLGKLMFLAGIRGAFYSNTNKIIGVRVKFYLVPTGLKNNM